MFKNMLDPAHASYDEEYGLRSLAAFLQNKPETAFQAYASRLLRPDKIADLDRKFPRSKYQSETDRAQAMLEHINAQLAGNATLTARWVRFRRIASNIRDRFDGGFQARN